MRNFQATFETRERSFVSAFSICMTVPLSIFDHSEASCIGEEPKIPGAEGDIEADTSPKAQELS